MTVSHFSEVNSIPRPLLQTILGLQSQQDLKKRLDSFGMSEQQLLEKVKQALALQDEVSSKNWVKIPLKFGLWFLVLLLAFTLIRKGKLDPSYRRGMYFTAALIFGVLLGSDPNPMGPVKDTIALYGTKGVIFKPRAVALTIFLATVLIANKFICAWGCQFGALQDLLFRLNRNRKDSAGIFQQRKPSFLVSNTIRILFFLLFTVSTFVWAIDLIEPIDPFKLYKPSAVSLEAGIFLGLLLLCSLFVYRPWCHFFCPFGLVGWLVEQISLFKIRVNRETCTECGACKKACPSSVMGAILQDQGIKPDCYACGTCIDSCPTGAIRFSRK
ncbi:MAG: 4Fe-4S binding protein [Desulfobulbaceae bacterium]|nr:4Fe-4S binding protein [Desulfobulbaceae bacterium]